MMFLQFFNFRNHIGPNFFVHICEITQNLQNLEVFFYSTSNICIEIFKIKSFISNNTNTVVNKHQFVFVVCVSDIAKISQQ